MHFLLNMNRNRLFHSRKILLGVALLGHFEADTEAHQWRVVMDS